MTVIFTLASLTMYTSVTYANSDDNVLIKTVYDVYVNGQKVGTVREKNVVDDAIDQVIT